MRPGTPTLVWGNSKNGRLMRMSGNTAGVARTPYISSPTLISINQVTAEVNKLATYPEWVELSCVNSELYVYQKACYTARRYVA